MDDSTDRTKARALTPDEYLLIERTETAKIHAAQQRIEAAKEAAKSAAFPASVRAAVPSDVVKDAILWYREDRTHWTVVREVLKPNDPWKGYEDDKGCLRGLDGAFVDVSASTVAAQEPTASSILADLHSGKLTRRDLVGASDDLIDRFVACYNVEREPWVSPWMKLQADDTTSRLVTLVFANGDYREEWLVLEGLIPQSLPAVPGEHAEAARRHHLGHFRALYESMAGSDNLIYRAGHCDCLEGPCEERPCPTAKKDGTR